MLMFVCTGTGEELGDPQEVCRDVVGGGGETRTGVTGPGQGQSADFVLTSGLRIFLLHGDITIPNDVEGQLTLGLCSALIAINQEGIFIMPHRL